MGMNQTPAGERVHIGFFGRRNAGKSSLVNAVTGQALAVVSEVKGTTTDPVYKSMELLPLGPVVMMDTPGIDDEGDLGALRVQKSYQVLNKTDAAVLVVDGSQGPGREEQALLQRIVKKGIPFVVVVNKADLLSQEEQDSLEREVEQLWAVLADSLHFSLRASRGLDGPQKWKERLFFVSARQGYGIEALKEALAGLPEEEEKGRKLVGDKIEPSDLVVLVIPIDKAAPKGRLILPQQQTIRDILDAGGVAMAVQEDQLKETLDTIGKKPKLVITDSQVFGKVAQDIGEEIPLTSFSILMARYKGDLEDVVKGVTALEELQDGDRILISEGCTHHRQCGDIGTVKLPAWIRQYTGKNLQFSFTSGQEFPEDLSGYQLVVHCGGCMLNRREMKYRQGSAADQNVPMTNYGILIAYVHGILKRSLEPFPEVIEKIWRH